MGEHFAVNTDSFDFLVLKSMFQGCRKFGNNVSPSLILLLTFIHFVSLCNALVIVALPFKSLII